MPTSSRTRTRLNVWQRARRGMLAPTRAARFRARILQAIKLYKMMIARRRLSRMYPNPTRFRRRGPSRDSRRLFKGVSKIKTKRYRPQWRQPHTIFSMY